MDQQQLESLLSIYYTKDGNVNANFSRAVKLLSKTDRRKVFAEIKHRGLDEQRNRLHQRHLAEKEDAKTFKLPPRIPSAIDPAVLAPVVSPLPSEDVVADDLDDLDNAVVSDDLDNSQDEDAEEEETRTGKRIIYTDAEWDRLADLVHSMRHRYPLPPLTRLITRAIHQTFPADRRRRLVGPAMRPIVDRLIKKETEQQVSLDAYHNYQQTIKTCGKIPTRSEIIASLTDEDLFKYKGRIREQITSELAQEMPPKLVSRILEQLSANEVVAAFDAEDLLDCIDLPTIIGHAAKAITENLSSWSGVIQTLGTPKPVVQKGPVAGPLKAAHKPPIPDIPKVARKPRVTVLGLLPNQRNILEGRFGHRTDLTMVDKNRGDNAIPDGQDVILYWARFASHSMQDQAKAKAKNGCILITHKGGLTKMIQKIEEAISQGNYNEN